MFVPLNAAVARNPDKANGVVIKGKAFEALFDFKNVGRKRGDEVAVIGQDLKGAKGVCKNGAVK